MSVRLAPREQPDRYGDGRLPHRRSNDPPACTVGFLPPSAWRSPADTTDDRHPRRAVLQAAAGLADRRARRAQLPVHGQPGKRAPTVETATATSPIEPLAMRQHALGPYPIDPNLIAQGIPPDDRVDYQDEHLRPDRGNATTASSRESAWAATRRRGAVTAGHTPDADTAARPGRRTGRGASGPKRVRRESVRARARRWPSRTTIRRPASIQRRTAISVNRPISSIRRRPGRT